MREYLSRYWLGIAAFVLIGAIMPYFTGSVDLCYLGCGRSAF